MSRRVAAALIAVILIAAAIPHTAAEPGAIRSLAVNPYGGAASDPDTVLWREIDGEYYLFLPGDADLGKLTVYFDADGDLFAAGVPLADGEATSAFDLGGSFALKCGDSQYVVHVMKGADVPSLFITTESGSLAAVNRSKKHKESGSLTVRDGGTSATLALDHIKGRGNSTWTPDKKPYTVKLSKKYDLLGMGKAKKWVLLASAYDKSFMRNTAALSLARDFGVEYTSECRYADVWANGEYIGLYVVCEKVEVGENRVELTDLDDANEAANPDVDLAEAPRVSLDAGYPGARKWVALENEPEDISGGYLLEADYQSRYDAEPGGFETPRGMNVTVISPEYPTRSELEYIADYFTAAEDAIYSPTGYNDEGRHYSSYFDLDSFARSYLLNEFTKNIDGGQTSFYMYKEAGDGKLRAAPAWDFDLSMGNFNMKVGLRTNDPKQWYNNILYYSEGDAGTELQASVDTVLCALWRHSEAFREIVRRDWSEFSALLTDEAIDALADEARAITASAMMNARRWEVFAGGDEVVRRSFGHMINECARFMKSRRDALETAFSPDGAMILYDPGEGVGHVLDGTMYTAGDIAVIKGEGSTKTGMRPPEDGMAFAGWNTSPDGTGQPFRQGDELILARGVTTLYAQWAAADDPAALWAQSWRYDASSSPIAQRNALSDDEREALALYEALRQSAASAARTAKGWTIGN